MPLSGSGRDQASVASDRSADAADSANPLAHLSEVRDLDLKLVKAAAEAEASRPEDTPLDGCRGGSAVVACAVSHWAWLARNATSDEYPSCSG
jgi:hypothetical protein